MERTYQPHSGASHQRFRRLVERVDGIIPWEADATTWRFTYVGPQAVKLLGYPQEEWYTEDFWVKRLHPDDREEAVQACKGALARDEDYQFDYRMLAADGRAVWIRDIVSIVRDEDESRLLQGFMLDITESKRGAEALEQARERLEQRVEARTAELRRANERLQEQIAERLRAEKALRESEERYRFVVENAPDFILMIDLQGQILFLNRSSPGWELEQIVGHSIYDFALPEYRAVLQGAFDQVLRSGKVVSYEAMGLGPNQTPSWFSSRVGPIRRDGQIVALILVSWNVTERKRAEEALRESEQRYRALAESSAVGIWHVTPEGRTIYLNPTMCSLLEIDGIEQLEGKTFHGFFTPESLQKIAVEHAKRAQGIASSYEAEMITRRGRRRSVVISGAPLFDTDGRLSSVIGTFTDITERKRAEEALRESEARLRLTVEALPVILWTTDTELRFTLSLGAGLAALDLQPNQVLGMRLFEFFQSTDPELLPIAAHLRALRGEAVDYEFEWKGRIFRCHVEPLRDERGQVLGTAGVASDVTASKHADQERRQIEQQIRHTQKLESLGVLAGGIAHDFNNLLMGILGNAGLALLETPAATPSRPYLERIESVALHAAELTNQMLAYSGRGKFVVQALDLSRLVKDMTPLLETAVSKKAELRFRLASGLPLVEADAAQLRQVVLNLVTNASEALGEQRGHITVRTGTQQVDRAYLAETYLETDLPEGLYAVVEVADSGCGMDRETQARIFDPFFTTKFTGRGLGLAAVLGIVRGHRGVIRLLSESGQGTSFTVLLPAARCVEEAPSVRGEPKPAAAGSGGRILVVDDEEVIRSLVQATLERFGFEVQTACDGCEAVELFGQRPEAFDAVLLDMTMPRMGGEETFQELRRLRPHVRIVLSSGYTHEEAAARFAGAGLDAFIQKPYQPRDLITTLRRVLQS
jgi:PAS domain S-box-containing protein